MVRNRAAISTERDSRVTSHYPVMSDATSSADCSHHKGQQGVHIIDRALNKKQKTIKNIGLLELLSISMGVVAGSPSNSLSPFRARHSRSVAFVYVLSD